jgi:hypothetical protein
MLAMHHDLPNSDMTLIKNAGHMLPIEQSRALAEYLASKSHKLCRLPCNHSVSPDNAPHKVLAMPRLSIGMSPVKIFKMRSKYESV